MRDVLNRTPMWTHVIDRQGQILYSNFFGQRAELPAPAPGDSIFSFILPEHHAAVRALFEQVITTGQQVQFEAAFTFGARAEQIMAHVVPIESSQNDGKTAALALFYPEAAFAQAVQAAMRQRTEELENRLAERNRVLQEYIRYVDAGGNLTIQLTRLNSIPVVLQTLAEQLMKAMEPSFTSIYRVEKDWIEYAAGVKSPILHHRRECLDEEKGILGQALRENNILFFEQLSDETAHQLWRTLPREFNLSSLIVVPIACTEALRGILYLGYNRPAHFDKNDKLVLRAFIETTIDTIHRIHLVQQLKRHIQAREQEISVLYDLSTYAIEPAELEELLHRSLRRVMKATRCDTGLIFWINENGAQEEMASCWPQTGIPQPIKLFLLENSRSKPSGRTETKLIPSAPAGNAYTCITVPITSKRRPNCFLRLFGDPQDLHGTEAIHLIVSAARQLGLSMDSALYRKLAENAIILEERQRMARNLHDSITQSLYALTLAGDVALKAYDRQEEDDLREALEDITNSSLQALKEMRLMLFELRPSALEKAGLIEALELRLNTVERRSGMDAGLEYSGKLEIPDAVEIELYSIISEALNNSLRHSGARSVSVRIRAGANLISVQVEDNGKGFELSNLPQGGLGLSSMRERVRKLGGKLSVDSQCGRGTRISFKVRVQGGT